MPQLTDPTIKQEKLNWPSREELLIDKDSILPAGQRLTTYFGAGDAKSLTDEVRKEAIQYCAGKCSPEEIDRMVERKVEGIRSDKLSSSSTASNCYVNLQGVSSAEAFKEYLKREDIPENILRLMARNVANHELFHCTQYKMAENPVSVLLKEVEADAVPATSMLLKAYLSKDQAMINDAVTVINEIISVRIRNQDAKYYSSIVYLRKLLAIKPEQLEESVEKNGLRYTMADLLEKTMKDVSLFDLYKSYNGKDPRY